MHVLFYQTFRVALVLNIFKETLTFVTNNRHSFFSSVIQKMCFIVVVLSLSREGIDDSCPVSFLFVCGIFLTNESLQRRQIYVVMFDYVPE